MKKLVFIVGIVFFLGCYANLSQSAQPEKMSAKNGKFIHIIDEKSSYSDDTISVSIIPFASGRMYYGYDRIILNVQNKSKKDIKLVWNESYFLNNNQADGGFMFEGVKYADRNNPKQDALILSDSTMKMHIFPNNKVVYLPHDPLAVQVGLPTGWAHAIIKKGTYGAYLQFTGKDYNKTVKLLFKIIENE